MSALIKVNPQLPAAIAKLAALMKPETSSELTGGVTSGFPIISYKGKVWRIRKSGEEQMYLDDQGNAMPSIEVVLVQANPQPSKIFYDKKYEDGSNESPRCFSNDGFKPDASVQLPISKVCATCPNNAWGSRITDNGKKSRACSDARRMAVVFAHDLLANGTDAEKLLLRVPPASLNPLKDYAEKLLAPKGIPFFAIVTRIGFDPQAAHPQFSFRPARLLTDDEAEAVAQLRGSEDVKRILSEAQEFAAGGAAPELDPSEAAANAPGPAPAATTPPAAKPRAAAMRPATDEEAGEAATPAPAPRPAAKAKPATPPPAPTAESDLDNLLNPAPAPAPAAPAPRAKKKTAAAPPPPPPAPVAAAAAEEEEEEEVAQPAAVTAAPKAAADFDGLLDSILNG